MTTTPTGTAHAPLSFAQQRLWFLWRMRPDGSEYNVPKATRLRGPIDVPALRWAVDRLAERHGILTATFPTVDGQPVQRFEPTASVPWHFVDLTDEPAEGRDARLDRAVAEAALAPFDLVHGPVFRAHLVRIAADDHVLVLAFHHIVVDGWSLGILDRELSAQYAARVHGEPDPLPAPAYQYEDYVDAERRLLDGPRGRAALEYWRQQLAGAPAHLPLPTDRPHRVPYVAGDIRPFEMSPELRARVEAVSREHRATRFVTLLSAYAALLFRSTGVSDLVIGVPVSGRTTLQVEGIVGLFVNMLPLRLKVTPSTTFAELLRQVRDTFLAGHEYQDLPFQRLVEELRPDRVASRQPIFQVAFAYEEPAAGLPGLGGLPYDAVRIPMDTAKFELTLQVTWGAGGWIGYQTDLFDDRTAERLAQRYHRLLTDAVAAPDTPVARLEVLDAQERSQLLDWAAPTFAATGRVERMVEWQATVRPDATAIRDGDRAVTYRELDTLADVVAGALRARGAAPGTLVATCLPRSADLVIAQLGVLKSGAAYLPLDPTNPASRLATVIDEADPVLVVSDAGHVDTFGATRACTPAALLATSALAPAPARSDDPADLAYVVYTSGSTGRPKGVMIAHHSLANLVAWQHRQFGMGPGDRTALVAAPGFDASVWEIWPALTAGVAVEIPAAETILAPPELRNWLIARGITYTFLPTPIAQRLAHDAWPADTRLTVLTGGDRLHELDGPLPFKLVNNYGPSESTVCATSGAVPAGGTEPGVPPHIGRPVTGVATFVLDAELALTPVGVPGELYLGGDALAVGYLGRPSQTADRFVPHPFSSLPGQRLYRTGDLVRWRSDGTLDFLGRSDKQLKIRGFRIEPAEIDAVLRTDPSIRDAVVTALPGADAEPVLAAYLVLADPAAAPDPGRLRDLVANTLPHYMVPHRFLVLRALPLTTNGKVDLAALPANAEELASTADVQHASTPMEHTIAAVWAAVVGHDAIDVRDNFFDVGGHSMMLAALAERLAERLGRPVPILDLYEYPTVAALARHLSGTATAGNGGPATRDGQRRRGGAARLRSVRARAGTRPVTSPDGLSRSGGRNA